MMIDEGVGDGLGWDGHLVLLHSSETFRRAAVTLWARRGLEQGAKIVHAEAGEGDAHRVFAGIGVDVAAGNGHGRLQALALEDFYVPSAQAKRINAALDEGYSSVRLLGSCAAALTVVSPQGYAEFERAMEALCASRPVSVLCQYDRAELTGQGLHEATDRHPQGIRELQLHTAAGTNVLRLAGQVDVANADLLACALRTATKQPAPVYCVDMGALSFLDITGCRALMEGTTGFRDAGGSVRLTSPQPAVHRVLRLLGIHQQHGVEMVEPER
jgi:anti-anti-sigma factor